MKDSRYANVCIQLQLFYTLKADCYVFCSYGSVKCPSIQETGKYDCC